MSTITYTSKTPTRDYKAQFQKKVETAARRAATMDVKVFQLKICENKLTKNQITFLSKVFIEGKWYHNSCVAFGQIEGNKPWENDYKKTTVVHYDKDKNPIESKFECLSAASRVEINKKVGLICKSIKALIKRKVIKHSRGLQFKSEYNSISYRQYGYRGWRIAGTKIKLSMCSEPFPVYGLEQLQIDGIEFANANLVQRPTGYYILVTAYVPKQPKQTNNQTVGIDFGCETSFTIYNEQLDQTEKFNFSFEQSEKAKRLKRRLSRRRAKGFSNKTNKGQRLSKLYRKHCEHWTNQKNDAANKFVHYLKQFEKIVIQDEMLIKWQKTNHGRKVQNGILGRVKEIIKHWPNVYMLDKSYPTSKFCFNCYHNNKDLKQWHRTYVCPYCGSTSDRDEHAAQNMIAFYHLIEMVPTEYRDPKRIRQLLIDIEKRVESNTSRSLQEIILDEIQVLTEKHEATH